LIWHLGGVNVVGFGDSTVRGDDARGAARGSYIDSTVGSHGGYGSVAGRFRFTDHGHDTTVMTLIRHAPGAVGEGDADDAGDGAIRAGLDNGSIWEGDENSVSVGFDDYLFCYCWCYN